MPAEFARVVVAARHDRVVCDPHEIANVLGADGVHWLLDATEGLPLRRLRDGAVVRAGQRASSRRAGRSGPDDMRGDPAPRRGARRGRDDELPGVIAGDPDVLAKVALRAARRRPRAGRDRRRRSTPTRPPASAPTTRRPPGEEALEKRRRGAVGADPRGLQRAQPARAAARWSARYGPEYCAFCTDDREPDLLVREGHIDQMCRVAVGGGDRARGRAADGHAAPGALPRAADLRRDRARLPRRPRAARRPRVVPRRRWCSQGGASRRATARRAVRRRRRCPPGCATACMRRRSAATRFALGPAGERVRVIEIDPGQLITSAARARRRCATAASSPTPRATWPRSPWSSATTRPAASASGWCAASGCAAARSPRPSRTTRTTSSSSASTTTTWPPARGGCAELGGGHRRRRRDGAVRGELALPVAGLLSERAGRGGRRAAGRAACACCASRACAIDAPFMTLSFLALSVIPALKITDRGLVDVDASSSSRSTSESAFRNERVWLGWLERVVTPNNSQIQL